MFGRLSNTLPGTILRENIRNMSMCKLSKALFGLVLMPFSVLATGLVNSNFGQSGTTELVLPNAGSAVTDLVLLADDRVVIAGGGFNFLTLARLDRSGHPDPALAGGNGFVNYYPPAIPVFRPEAFAANSDYEMFAVGYDITTSNNAYAIKFRDDGLIDQGFASNGVFTASSHPRLGNTGIDTEFNAVAVQPDGKVVIAGRYRTPSGGVFLLRLDRRGVPDVDFGPMADGLAFMGPLPFGSNSINGTNATDLRVLDSGEILLAGLSQSGGWGSLVARFTHKGRLDTSFNGNGFHLLSPMGSNIDWSGHVEVDHLGQVYLLSRLTSGPAGSGSTFDRCLLTRFLPNGQMDTHFGVHGQIILTPPAGEVYNCGSLTLTREGGIAIGAMGNDPTLTSTTNGPVYVFRLDSRGNLEQNFGINGVSQIAAPYITNRTYYAGLFDNVFVDVQSDGKLIFASGVYNNSGIGYTVGQLEDNPDRVYLTPNGFQSMGMQPPLSWVYSNVVQIAGLHSDARVVVEVENGQYSINGGTYTSSPGYVKNGDQIRLRNITSSSSSATAITQLRVGGSRDRKNAGVVRGIVQRYQFAISTGVI